MHGLFRRPYPLQPSAARHAVTALLFGAFVAAFLLLFRPFGLHAVPGIGLLAAAYGATCTAAMLLLNVALPPLLPRWFTEARWTVGRELGWTLLNVALIGMANALLSVALGLVPLSAATLGRFTLFTVAIGLFPITLSVLLNEARRARHYRAGSAAINADLAAPEPDPARAPAAQGPGITLPAEGNAGTLHLGPEDLVYMRAADNYVDVFHLHADKPMRTVLRGSLKAMAAVLEPLGPRYLRCHKSHLVDLHKVVRVSGNAQGLRLHVRDADEPIPVSRQLTATVRNRLAARP